ncbi:hypothetical protein AQUCO_05600034v1 [Aquilegia coerulea]|uniref:Mitochondrial import inner membrane translocase subunit TIM22 n=1 Tax=Aquilegia coerulea TaxID=218851 RepID=A0A2G5CG70_AQUCA|nr:hypothetical protein AQUCO_05600034v1 [Aquilegia coerulea]
MKEEDSAVAEPFPDGILKDAGTGFAFGMFGGSAFHFFKSMYHSPAGARFLAGTQAAKMNAPRLACTFAVWSGLFSTFHYTSSYLQQKEDQWNSIIAGAAAAGLLNIRSGLPAAAGSAVFTAACFALLEGMQRKLVLSEGIVRPTPISPRSTAKIIEQSSSLLGQILGDLKTQEMAREGANIREILRSFDKPTYSLFGV